jgi:hypothetical protein
MRFLSRAQNWLARRRFTHPASIGDREILEWRAPGESYRLLWSELAKVTVLTTPTARLRISTSCSGTETTDPCSCPTATPMRRSSAGWCPCRFRRGATLERDAVHTGSELPLLAGAGRAEGATSGA